MHECVQFYNVIFCGFVLSDKRTLVIQRCIWYLAAPKVMQKILRFCNCMQFDDGSFPFLYTCWIGAYY